MTHEFIDLYHYVNNLSHNMVIGGVVTSKSHALA